MSFPVINAMMPIKVRATMSDSKDKVKKCTIVLKMLGVFIRYISMRSSQKNTQHSTIISTNLSFNLSL